jgi:hypothetical protein
VALPGICSLSAYTENFELAASLIVRAKSSLSLSFSSASPHLFPSPSSYWFCFSGEPLILQIAKHQSGIVWPRPPAEPIIRACLYINECELKKVPSSPPIFSLIYSWIATINF